jgi:nicotinamide mononucleotide (NMN) deamidase PncC
MLQVAEFDTPYSLVTREGGVLAQLVAQTGDASRERLVEMARQAHLAAQKLAATASAVVAAPEEVSLSL